MFYWLRWLIEINESLFVKWNHVWLEFWYKKKLKSLRFSGKFKYFFFQVWTQCSYFHIYHFGCLENSFLWFYNSRKVCSFFLFFFKFFFSLLLDYMWMLVVNIILYVYIQRQDIIVLIFTYSSPHIHHSTRFHIKSQNRNFIVIFI